MTFLAPLHLIAAVLIALPIAIHLLVRRRAKRLDFPSLRFLRETTTFRFRPRRVRQPLLLALRVLALLLLIAGLARPLITYRGRQPLTRVILLDSSLSVRAGGRAEAAKQQARAILERLGKGERAALITFSTEAVVLVSPTSDRQQLETALQRYVADGAAANYANGLAAAEALLGSEPPGPAEIDLVSDFQQSGLAAPSDTARAESLVTIVTYPVGADLRQNTFLTGVSVSRTAQGIELSAAEVTSDSSGRAGFRRNWLLNSPAGEQAGITWRTESNGQTVGSLNVSAPDDVQLDNRYFFSFFPPLSARALLVSKAATDEVYWQAALEAAAGKDSRLVLEKVEDLQSTTATDYALIVATLSRSPDRNEVRRLVDLAEQGATVWLNVAPETDAKAWSEFVGSVAGSKLPFTSLGPAGGDDVRLHFATADLGAPFLRSFDQKALDALRTTNQKKAFSFVARDDAASLLRWDNDHTALVWRRVGAGLILVLGTTPGLESGDLGLSPAFPVLVGSMLDAATSTPELASYEVGKPVTSIGSGTVSITDPEGNVKNRSARDLAAHPQSVFSNPGIYRVDAGGQTRFLALNFPPEESDRLVASAEEIRDRFANRAKPGNVSGSTWRDVTESAGSHWRYFLGLAFLLLLLELFLVIRQGRPLGTY